MGNIEISKCEVCRIGTQLSELKCCFNCALDPEKCNVWHECGHDCPGWCSNDLISRNALWKKFDTAGLFVDRADRDIAQEIVEGMPAAGSVRKSDNLSANENKAMYMPAPEAWADRCKFVAGLGELLKQTRESIVGVYLDEGELIHICYKGGHEAIVNVAQDSYLGILKDVARRL